MDLAQIHRISEVLYGQVDDDKRDLDTVEAMINAALTNNGYTYMQFLSYQAHLVMNAPPPVWYTEEIV